MCSNFGGKVDIGSKSADVVRCYLDTLCKISKLVLCALQQDPAQVSSLAMLCMDPHYRTQVFQNTKEICKICADMCRCSEYTAQVHHAFICSSVPDRMNGS